MPATQTQSNHIYNNNVVELGTKIKKNETEDQEFEKMKQDLFDKVNFNHKKLRLLCQNGYTQINNGILYKLMNKNQSDLKSFDELSVILYILKMTHGFQRNSFSYNVKKIAMNTGIIDKNVYRAMKNLEEKGYIRTENKKVFVEIDYEPSKNYTIFPDFLMYSIMNRKYNGLKGLSSAQVLLYIIKRTLGYVETKHNTKSYHNNEGKLIKEFDRKKTHDYKRTFYLKNGFIDICEYTGISKSNMTKIMRNLEYVGIITTNRENGVTIKFNINIREWENGEKLADKARKIDW